MAVRHGYGKIAGTDALVFAYDTGDTRNSYRGEPTTNVYGNWVQYTANSYEVLDNSTNYVKLLASAGTPWAGRFDTTVSAGTYTLSFQHRTDDGGSNSFNIDNDTQDNDIWNANITTTTEWQTYTSTKTHTGTGTHALYFRRNGGSGNIYIRNVQLELKSHATPFVKGTRSATQGLLDLTGNHTIDLSNTGFDSNAQPVFDGTNDHMSVGTGILSGTGNFTVEAVIQSDYQETNGTIFANYPSGNFQTFFSGRFIGLYLANSSTYLGTAPFTTVLPEFTTDPIHFLAQREGTTTRLYINGVLKKTGSSSSTIGSTSATFRVGANTSGTEDFLGSIYVVKAYNRALTEAEIRNNYNFYKSRFGI